MGLTRTRESIYVPSQVILISGGSDTIIYEPPLRAISVGTEGDIQVEMAGEEGVTVVIPQNAIARGIQQVGYFRRIYATNTDASEIVGWR